MLLGSTEVRGASLFAAIDFQRATEVFAPLPLDEVGGRTQPAVLHLRDLTLFNLPQTLAARDEVSVGGVSSRALSALLWISKPRTSRADSAGYVLDRVTASVSCAEVSFLKHLLQRLQQNAGDSDSDIVLDFMARLPLPHPEPCHHEPTLARRLSGVNISR